MFRSIAEAGAALRSRRVSCAELVAESLRRINELDRNYNAFLTVTADGAQQAALQLDEELAAGRTRGPLHGIPIAFKDLFYTSGVRTTNGSKLFADFIPDYDAAVVTKLREAGAISMGKLNMHELAYGVTSTNPHFGPVRNPHASDRIPGGSSGGSGAAVAAGMVFMAMGSDTGGSIRIPASYCGTVGLKPTFDVVSRHGAFPLGLTLDHMGPLTRTVEDASVCLQAMALFRPDAEAPSVSGVRIGLPRNFFNTAVDNEVSAAVQQTATEAERAGAELVHIDVPDPAALNVVARTVLLSEAASVLGPYLHRRDEIGSDVLALLDQGRLLPGTDYVTAQRIRYALQQQWAALFRTIDYLLIPTTPIPAPKIGQRTVTIQGSEEDTRLASTRFVRGINVLGLPAISLPAGKNAEGLPLAVQLVGRAYDDAGLLRVAAALQQLTV